MRVNPQVSESMDELVNSYVSHKEDLDDLKKVCDAENSEIKQRLYDSGEKNYTVDGITVTRSVATKQSVNEAKLISVLKQYGVADGIVKTKEYIDMDALENFMYLKVNAEFSEFTDIANAIGSCIKETEVVSLRVSKKKGAKE